MLKQKIIFLLFTCLFFCNCSKRESKVFYGKYILEDTKLSNSLILDFTNKKVLSENKETDLDLYRLTDSTLVKGNKIYNFIIKGDILRTYENEKVIHVFQRAIAYSPNINSIRELSTLLRSQVWKDSSKAKEENESLQKQISYDFGDSLVRRDINYYLNEELIYSELEIFPYKISQYEESYFILLEGKHSESRYSVLLQVKDIPPKKLILSGIKSFKNFELHGSEMKRNSRNQQIQEFVVCNEDIIGQYYYNGMGSQHEGGLNKVRQIFEKKVNISGKESDTGYIRIRFMINCEGETGRFSILEVDKDYAPTSFSHELVVQLFQFTRNLSSWELEKLPETGKTYDNYRHLSFKIQNGKVLDILP